MGGKDGHQGPALRDRARRRPGVLARHPLERRPDALPGQHAHQDEARHEARQPHRRGAQRLVALHGRRRPGREQHPPLDHRERLARGHRRPAAQHVLQHRHRDLHLGAHQPQARSTARGQVQLIDATQWFKPLRKNLGKKNCELSDDDIERICDTFLAFEETEQSKIFPNAAFGYWKVTVERPLRLKGIDPERAYSRRRRSRPSRRTAERAEDAPPRHQEDPQDAAPQPDSAARPVRGHHRRQAAVVEYEPDSDLRDTEQVPLLEEGGIEAFLRREVLPHAPDAWYDPTASRPATRSASPATSTSPSRCARWRRSAPTSWRWRRKRKGCWRDHWGEGTEPCPPSATPSRRTRSRRCSPGSSRARSPFPRSSAPSCGSRPRSATCSTRSTRAIRSATSSPGATRR